MDATTKKLVTAGLLAVGTVAGTYVLTKRAMVKRCKRKVLDDCTKVPLIGTDEFCGDMAKDICDG